MHMESLESTQKALLLRIFSVLQILRVHPYAKLEQILKQMYVICRLHPTMPCYPCFVFIR